MLSEIRALGVRHVLATEDGSVGIAGRVTVPFAARLAELQRSEAAVSVLACGPTPMLEAVRRMGLDAGVPTYISLEERMACGIGVCLGCAVPVYGPRPYEYCCDQGPVYDARKVRWS
jgi:dihydroorotate dehydrogenase electron transfer subunit